MRITSLLFFSACFLLTLNSFGSHLRCGQIIVRQVAPGSKTVSVTIEVFTNRINTNVLFGGEEDWLDLGDGTWILVPAQEGIIGPEFGPGFAVAYAYYTITHTYANLGSYTVSYREPNRSSGIINFDNSSSTKMYIESRFRLMENKAYRSPVSLLFPVMYGSANGDFSASFASVDENAFALMYSMEVPLREIDREVINFRSPASLHLNSLTGLLTWDGRFEGRNVVGEFLFALKVRQFDMATQPWDEIGYVYRDLQIILADDDPERRIAGSIGPDDNVIVVPENTSRSVRVFAFHDAAEEPEFIVATELPNDYYSFESYDSLHDSKHILVGKLTVTTDALIARPTPYPLTIRASFKASMYDKYYRDLAYAFTTSEFTPDFAPIVRPAEDKISVSLYPNPTRDFVWLDASNNELVTVHFYNSIGQLVAKFAGTWPSLFDLRTLSPGVYMVKCISADGHPLSELRMVKE